MWAAEATNLELYVPGITPAEIQYLDNTQGFCPDVRGNQDSRAIRELGGCTNAKDENDQTCFYVYNTVVTGRIVRQKASVTGAPGLYAQQLLMRYSDPLYHYDSKLKLSVANPAIHPFINVNQMWESKQHTIYAGQCPLMDIEPGRATSTVCQWLQFLVNKKVDLLVSLSPSQAEKEASRAGKSKCQDYIMTMAHAEEINGEQNKVCNGLPYSVDAEEMPPPSSWTIGTQTGQIFKRKVNFNRYRFTQLYFDGWPDAHGETNPPVPPVQAVQILIKDASEYKNVAVHCAGGRGRTGTIVTGIVTTWQAAQRGMSASMMAKRRLVSNILDFRQRRADFVESFTQLELLGVAFNISSPQAPPLNEQVG